MKYHFMTKAYSERPIITESKASHYSTHKPELHLRIEIKKHKANCWKRQRAMLKLQELLEKRRLE